jgi:hypothetical protein
MNVEAGRHRAGREAPHRCKDRLGTVPSSIELARSQVMLSRAACDVISL